LIKTYAESTHIFKAGVAIAFCEMTPLLGKDYVMQSIMPVLLDLMKDDNSEVRLNCIENLGKVIKVAGQEAFTPALQSTLTNLTNDP
jgi:serine/threonine-protein phosphatase 2A regulatory subunit A